MGYRLIVERGRYKAELRIEMNGANKKGREMRRQSKCVEGGESSNRMRERGTNRADMSSRQIPKSANEIM
jgi:hypothetical protein